MSGLLAAMAVAVALASTAPAAPVVVRGQVLHGQKGVPGALVSLVENDPALVAVNPGGARRADAEGRFEFPPVDGAKRWLLVVFDPFRPGEISVVTPARTDSPNALHVKRLITFAEPAADSVITGPKVRIRFTEVPGAARYTLQVEERHSMARSRKAVTLPEAEIVVQPARSYALSVTAEDAGGVEIGANIIHGGPVYTFGVSDPAAEAALVPASVECSIGGLEPKLRVAPSVSPEAEVSFMVSRGDRIRLLGKWKEWRKVETLSGYYPGRRGWLTAGEVACPPK